MKNMKKIIAVLLVLAALASLFTACSTKPAESSTTAANPSELLPRQQTRQRRLWNL